MQPEAGSGLGSIWKMVPFILEIKLYASFFTVSSRFSLIFSSLDISFTLLNNFQPIHFSVCNCTFLSHWYLNIQSSAEKCYSMVKFSTSRDQIIHSSLFHWRLHSYWTPFFASAPLNVLTLLFLVLKLFSCTLPDTAAPTSLQLFNTLCWGVEPSEHLVAFVLVTFIIFWPAFSLWR